MLYSKPEDKRYVDMCKEFDEEFYTPNRDNDKMFKYMYLTFYMLACKHNYFKKFEDYDGYAQYAATKIFTRYLKKERQGVQIKSLLNYANGCIGHLKVDYQNENFEQVTQEGDEDVCLFEQSYRDAIRVNYNKDDLMMDTEELLRTIPQIARRVLDESPYKTNKLILKRLYMSCMLTILDSVTLPKCVLDKVQIKKENKDLKDNYIIKQYQKNMQDALILWDLDDDYSDIVKLLVNKIRSEMSSEINAVSASYAVPDDVIDAIISSAYDEKAYTNYDEKVFSYDGLSR